MNKKFIFTLVAALVATIGMTSTTKADLLMTGILDGTLTGGEPKVVELYATADIADLSTYALSRAGNGSTTFDTITADFILPSVSLTAGDFYYAVAGPFGDQTANFDTIFPGQMRSRNYGVNSNGDDVTALFFDATGAFAGGETQVDVFGVVGVDGTGQSWEHLDSWAYRVDGTTADGNFTESNWTIAAPNSLDGLDAAGIAAAVPFGTFNAVPEPGSALVLAGMFGLVGLRRRK